jgi:hypothetical protein
MSLPHKRGYFAEEGLIVEIILMPASPARGALIGNSVELASGQQPDPGNPRRKAENAHGVRRQAIGSADRAAFNQERRRVARQTNRFHRGQPQIRLNPDSAVEKFHGD